MYCFSIKKVGSRWKLDQDPSALKTNQYPDPLYVKLHPEFKLSVEREKREGIKHIHISLWAQ
jgi:hypothetical protein